MKLMGVFAVSVMGFSVLFSVSVVFKDPPSDVLWTVVDARNLDFKVQKGILIVFFSVFFFFFLCIFELFMFSYESYLFVFLFNFPVFVCYFFLILILWSSDDANFVLICLQLSKLFARRV